MLRMRDVSNHQGALDISSKFPDAHVIACKATEGTGFADPTFQSDWNQAKAADKARIAYHFFHPSISAMAQARFFLDNVATAGMRNGDLLAIDLEASDGMPAAKVAAAAVEFVHAVEKETRAKPLVYTFIDFAHEGNCQGLGGYPLWIADPSSPAGRPVVPPPWETWLIHQYGVLRRIDIDVVNVDTIESLVRHGVLEQAPALGDHERIVRLTTGDEIVERVVSKVNLDSGWHIDLGPIRFEIL